MEGKRRATRVHLLSATVAHSLPPPRSVLQASHVASEETETQRKEASRRTSRPRLRTGDLGLGRGTGTCAQRDPRRLNAPPSPLAAVQVPQLQLVDKGLALRSHRALLQEPAACRGDQLRWGGDAPKVSGAGAAAG